ncbi:MAG: 30S ribosomal protein S15 [Patescibacteria group bacterium]
MKKTEEKQENQKKNLVEQVRSHKNDTGSTTVQIALISDRITELAKHLQKHAKDFDSKRGLLMMIGKRRRLLNYLQRTSVKDYAKLISELKLKK